MLHTENPDNCASDQQRNPSREVYVSSTRNRGLICAESPEPGALDAISPGSAGLETKFAKRKSVTWKDEVNRCPNPICHADRQQLSTPVKISDATREARHDLVAQRPRLTTTTNNVLASSYPARTSSGSSLKFTTPNGRRRSHPLNTHPRASDAVRPPNTSTGHTNQPSIDRNSWSLFSWRPVRQESIVPSPRPSPTRSASEQPRSNRLRWLPFRGTLPSSPLSTELDPHARNENMAPSSTSSSFSGFSAATSGSKVHELMVERDLRTGNKYLNRRFAGLDL